jgi:NADH-quinone oxidoreductase subunit M
VVFAHNHKIRFDVLAFSFSISSITYHFTSLEIYTVYSLSQINVWFLSRRNNNYIGCLLYVENVPTSNVGETNTKVFADVTFKKDLLWFLSSLYYSFGMYPKPITDLITPSLENILTQINRIN